jgi:hypothetical protein
VLDQWLCESVRLSALWPIAPGKSSSPLTFKEFAGTDPDSREEQLKFGMLREVGTVLDGSVNLEMRQTPGRFDWIMGPVMQVSVPASEATKFFHIGAVPDAIKRFSELPLLRVARDFAQPPRFAYGIVAYSTVNDVDASHRQLATLLHLKDFDLRDATEFALQINRPRFSSVVKDLKINRLSRWATVRILGFHFAVPHGEKVVQPTSPPLVATRVDIDVNTDENRSEPIPTDKIPNLLDELTSFTLEIAEKGDVK